jgi:branched-chain amino acid transport system substrate-binding protein
MAKLNFITSVLTKSFIILLSSSFLNVYATTHAAKKANMQDSIKIGAIFNLTGPLSALDNYALQGAKLAVAEINSAGGIYGKKLELEIHDGKTNPYIIAEEAKKLANKNDIAEVIIGLTDTDMAIAAIPPIAHANKLFITPGATSPKLSALAPKHVLLACFSDNNQATAGAAFTGKVLNAKKVYIITQKDSEYAVLLTQYFKNSFLHLNGKILGTAYITNETTSISDITKTIPAKPDAFYLAAGPEITPMVVNQLRKAGFNQPIVGGDAFDNKDLFALKNSILSNIYFTTHAFITKNNPDLQVQQFIKSYEKTYKKVPDTSFSGLGYDTVKLLAEAIKQSASTSADKIRTALLHIHDFDGVTGKISYVNDNPIPIKTVSIVQIQNGKRSLVREWP